MRAALGAACLVLTLSACTCINPRRNGAAAPTAATDAQPVQSISSDAYCVTCGALRPLTQGRVMVESSKMRAVVDQLTGNSVALEFTYLGPTKRLMALSSGLSRSQVGIKLFAHDACNLVYVMWRLSPEPGIVVSTKRNIGMQQSSSCGNQGYKNIRPLQQAPTPAVAEGTQHRLRVERNGSALFVYADEVLAWQGQLAADLPEDLSGLTGMRSDNGRYILKLSVSQDVPRGRWLGVKPTCSANRPSLEE